jgi:CrcB protein
MTHLLAIALGGALGAMSRYGVNGLIFPLLGEKFPLGTLVVNVLGSLVMGICYVLIIEKALLPPEWRNILMVGFLGAFTTFSTFSLDALALWQNGQLLLALGYVIASVTLCLLAIALAIYCTRLL